MNIVSSAGLSERHQKALPQDFPQHQFFFFKNIEEAAPKLPEADVLITYGEDLNEEIIDRCHRLKWIQVISAGIDKMPMKAIEERNILVTNARGIHVIPMAEYTIGMMLQFARKFIPFYENQKKAKWDASIRMEEIHGKTLGVLGTGAIGQAIAKRARAFGMKTLGLSRSGKMVEGFERVYTHDELYELLPQCDYVVSILPLTPETEGWIGEKAFSAMKDSAVFINVGRGTVVDEPALINALQNGQIRYAILDVTAVEPLPESSPLWKMENVIITPHASSHSPHYVARSLEIFRNNLKVYPEQSNMVNVIPKGKGY